MELIHSASWFKPWSRQELEIFVTECIYFQNHVTPESSQSFPKTESEIRRCSILPNNPVGGLFPGLLSDSDWQLKSPPPSAGTLAQVGCEPSRTDSVPTGTMTFMLLRIQLLLLCTTLSRLLSSTLWTLLCTMCLSFVGETLCPPILMACRQPDSPICLTPLKPHPGKLSKPYN